MLALSLGLREGELLGLRWQDVDLAAGTLTVAGALKRVPRSVRTPGQPARVRGLAKTPRSRRTLALDSTCIEVLAAHRERQRRERAATPAWPEPELVFTTDRGASVHHGVLTHMLRRRLAAAGLPYRPLRTLRPGSQA